MILDAGCGYLDKEKRRTGVGIDLHKGKCDVVADVQKLPFRDEVFTFVYARNILEHLDNVLEALIDIKRVTTTNGKISITIPTRHNLCMDELVKFIVNFPMRTPRTIKRLLRWRKHGKEEGFWHKNRITQKEISQFFHINQTGQEFITYYPIKALQKLHLLDRTIRTWVTPHITYILAEKK